MGNVNVPLDTIGKMVHVDCVAWTSIMQPVMVLIVHVYLIILVLPKEINYIVLCVASSILILKVEGDQSAIARMDGAIPLHQMENVTIGV